MSTCVYISPSFINNQSTIISLKITLHSFYEYWSRFESWRDFSLKAAEHDLETAGSREEKRWMQKENDKRCVLVYGCVCHILTN